MSVITRKQRKGQDGVKVYRSFSRQIATVGAVGLAEGSVSTYCSSGFCRKCSGLVEVRAALGLRKIGERSREIYG